jgi:aminoglycoside 3-N-acetyltransferase I
MIKIHRLELSQSDVFRSVLMLFEEVFGIPHGAALSEKYLQKLLAEKGFSVFVAMTDEVIVGALTAYTMESYYSEKPFIYLFDLAVRGANQRQGVGSQLLQALRVYGKEIGAVEVFVQADLEDEHAIDFYTKNGGTPESVVHFTYPI